MKRERDDRKSGRPWGDPSFFGFILLGIALLCTGMLCKAKARHFNPRETETVPLMVPVEPPTHLPDSPHLRPSSDEDFELPRALVF